jgi:hypothetical protein
MWLLLKRRNGQFVSLQRDDLGNRASTVLIDEVWEFEVPSTLDDIIDSLDKIAVRNKKVLCSLDRR